MQACKYCGSTSLMKHQSLEGKTPAQTSGIHLRNDWHGLVKEATKTKAIMELAAKNGKPSQVEEQPIVVMTK